VRVDPKAPTVGGMDSPPAGHRPEDRTLDDRDQEQDGPPLYRPGAVLQNTYEVGTLIGRGGMGQVFEAWDRNLQRVVAIKAPKDAKAGEKLIAEARALAQVRHDSLVAVHALGMHEGTPYVVMERLRGTTLEEHIDRRIALSDPFSIEDAIDILIAIAEGLDRVHGAGISHRDVKPANVILTGQRVVLVDFGLVTPEYEGPTGPRVLGSPGYIAPEVIQGTVTPGLGHQADTYSLGALAFELLTGELPFDEEDMETMLERHVLAPVPDPTALRPSLPSALSTLVRGMLAKDPSDRPESQEEILWRLRDMRRQARHRNELGRAVLVIEDDPALASIISEWVSGWAPEAGVVTASSAEEGLRLMGRQRFDMLLLDLQLPGMSGVELLMYLRGGKRLDDCTVVAMSAQAGDADVALLEQMGCGLFLEKGDDLQTGLRDIVHQRLGLAPVSALRS